MQQEAAAAIEERDAGHVVELALLQVIVGRRDARQAEHAIAEVRIQLLVIAQRPPRSNWPDIASVSRAADRTTKSWPAFGPLIITALPAVP